MSDPDDYEDDEDANAVIYIDELECFTSIEEGKEAEYREVFVWKWPGDNEEELKEWMHFAGDVEMATLLTRDGQHTGMAYVLYADAEGAQACIDHLGNENDQDVQAQWSESERWSKRSFGFVTALDTKLEASLADTTVVGSPIRFIMKPGVATDEYLEHVAHFVQTVHEDLQMLSENPNSLILYNCPLKWKKQDIQTLMSEFGTPSHILVAKEAFTHKALVILENDSVVDAALEGLSGRDVWAGPQKQKLYTLSLITPSERPIVKKERPHLETGTLGERRQALSRLDISLKAPQGDSAMSCALSNAAPAKNSKHSLYIFVDELNTSFPPPLSTYDPKEVYISNFPDDVTESDIRTAVLEIGEITCLNVITGSRQPPRAYVRFKQPRIAKNLVTKGWIFSFDAQKRVKICFSLSEMILNGLAAFGVECLQALVTHAQKFQLSQDIFGLGLCKARDADHQQLHFKSLNWHAFATALRDISTIVHGKMMEEQHAAARAAAQGSVHLAAIGLLPGQTPLSARATQALTQLRNTHVNMDPANTHAPEPAPVRAPAPSHVSTMTRRAQPSNTAQHKQVMHHPRSMEERPRSAPQQKGVQYGTPASASKAARSSKKVSPLHWLMIRGFPHDWQEEELHDMLAPYKPLEVRVETGSKMYPHGVARVRVEQPARLLAEMNNQYPAHDSKGPRLHIQSTAPPLNSTTPTLDSSREGASAHCTYRAPRNLCPPQPCRSDAPSHTVPPSRPPFSAAQRQLESAAQRQVESAAQRQPPRIPPAGKATMKNEDKDDPRSLMPPKGSRVSNSRDNTTDELAPPTPKSKAAMKTAFEKRNIEKAAAAVSLIKTAVKRKQLLHSNLSKFRPLQVKRARSSNTQADTLSRIQNDEHRDSTRGKWDAGTEKPGDDDVDKVNVDSTAISTECKTCYVCGATGHHRKDCPKVAKAPEKTTGGMVIGRRVARAPAKTTRALPYSPSARSGLAVSIDARAIPQRAGIMPIRSAISRHAGIVSSHDGAVPINSVVPQSTGVLVPTGGVPVRTGSVTVRTSGVPVKTGGLPVRAGTVSVRPITVPVWSSAFLRTSGGATRPPPLEMRQDVLWPEADEWTDASEWDGGTSDVAPPTSKARPSVRGITAKPNFTSRRVASPASSSEPAPDCAKRRAVLTKRKEPWPEQPTKRKLLLPEQSAKWPPRHVMEPQKEKSVRKTRRGGKVEIAIAPAVWKANSYPHLVSTKMFGDDQAITSRLLEGRKSLEGSVRDRLRGKKTAAAAKLNTGIDTMAEVITTLTETRLKEELRREVTWYMEWHENHP